ncbi:hypothetical protein KR018_007811 [Drosophila ironensis]|nr:hypothetical protein KR018_007811 [Drosophila ironensis]
MASKYIEIPRDEWADLKDSYAGDRTNLCGVYLLEFYIKYQTTSEKESINIYTTDKNWRTHGNYVLVHHDNQSDVFFNTIKGSPEDLKHLLCSLELKGIHVLCGYGKHFKTLVEEYWLQKGLDLNKLEHQGTVVYHLPSSEVQKWTEDSLNPSMRFGYLTNKQANLVDQHWAYRNPKSLKLITGLLETNISAGVFDTLGQPLAWCLRSCHGTLCNLHVLEDHRRKGLASLVVRFMAKEVVGLGSEVLATVVFENINSRNMFEKLGFQAIGEAYWVEVPAI